jgi:Rieske Fe-S protein
MPSIRRSRRLVLIAAGAGLGASALTALPGCGDNSGADDMGFVLRFPFSQYPRLQSAGGFSYSISPVGTLLIVRLSDTTATALHADCTHMGCPVGYTSPTAPLLCPCHGSEYSLTGNVLRGPATAPLTVFQTSVDATGITVFAH